MIRPTLIGLLITLILPAGIYTLIAAPSHGPGLLLAAFLWICIGLATAQRPYVLHRSDAYTVGAILALCGVLFIHLMIEVLQIGNVSFTRFFTSCGFLVLLGVGTDFAARNLLRERPADLIKAADTLLVLLALMGLTSLAGAPHIGLQASAKSIVLFAEPSHFGLALLPVLLFRASISTKSQQFALLFGALALGALLQSLTTLVGIMLLATLLLRSKVVAAMLLVATPIAFVLDLTYYADRLNLSSDTDNISTLVFLQGWENATLNFIETHGFGVGFQQFGISGSIGDIAEKIALLMGGSYLSLLDGGSTATKLIAEFGVFGIFILVIYMRRVLKGVAEIRAQQLLAPHERDVQRIFFQSLIVSYSLELFIRGVGYFSAGGFLAVTAFIALHRLKRPVATHEARIHALLSKS